MRRTTFFLIMITLFLPAACQEDTPAPTVMPTAVPADAETSASEGETAVNASTATAVPTDTPAPPTPTPLPPRQMVVMLAQEPESLFIYSDSSLAATAVRHGIYENLITSLGYDHQAQGIEKLPSLADGDAVINTVTVSAGDTVLNSSGDPVRLAPGVQIITADGEFLTFSGDEEAVTMLQMVVAFTLKPLVWSDGVPVTAVDSVFSFNIAADPLTPVDKTKIERTAAYEAVGDLDVRWTGLPGFLDDTYFLNVWTPLPNHQLSSTPVAEMITGDETTKRPLSSGPFMVAEWEPGSHLLLTTNPHYYRLAEGYPRIDEVTFRFGSETDPDLAGILDGSVDILTQGNFLQNQETIVPDLLQSEAEGSVAAYYQPISVFEHIDFGIVPVEEYAETRPDWFGDVRVRQAMTQCTDRQRMVDELMFGKGDVLHAYVPDAHPLFPDDIFMQTFDPAGANGLLDEAGLEDTDGDGIREWIERDQGEIVATTPFGITLGTDSESGLRRRLNEMFAEDMQACGIHVELYDIPVIDWYADGPFSPLFGRRFDLATFAWLTNIRPPCNLYLSRNITGPEEQGFGGWANVNATGWSDEAFDEACTQALAALPGTPEYATYHQEAIRVFSEQLPVIPLFSQMKIAVTRPTVLNFKPDPTQPSALWNLFEIDVEDE